MKNSNNSNICYINLSDDELKRVLTPEQYRITKEKGTEKPFDNEYWDNHDQGIYLDIISKTPLFSSNEKYDSGTGWPSFFQLIRKESIKYVEDNSFGMLRTEVRSFYSDAHLGHLFYDGPEPTGLRFCINSASLDFISVDKMEEKGYGKYLFLFPDFLQKKSGYNIAVLAGGCFWGIEAYFKLINGVKYTIPGYCGGKTDYPGYNEVCSGKTGHAESVWICFDPNVVSYLNILEHFFRIHDPTTKNRQGNDIGSQYRSVIFYNNDSQKKEAAEFIKRIEIKKMFNKQILTELVSYNDNPFFAAEEYHLDYLDKHPDGYCHINLNLAKKPLN